MVKLAYLENDAARKVRLKKRRAGLFKKLRELSTLCGVNAFAIVYSPDDSQPAVWPSRFEAQQLLRRLQGMPEVERCRKTMDQESYLKERVEKAQLKLRKMEKRNKEMERSNLMHQFYHLEGKNIGGFGSRELHGLLWMLEERIDEITRRVDYFKQFPPIGGSHFAWGGPEVGQMGWEDNNGVCGGGGNPTEAILWDPRLTKVMSNTDNIMGRAGGTESGMGLPNAYNVGGRGPIGHAFRLGPPYTGGTVDIIDFG